jgi:hypothetical protein
VPKTRAQAVRLARTVAAEPVNWGPGFVKRDPYESDPGFWPVLDANCVWQREPLPETPLAALTRYSELPAEDSKGPIRVTAVVTVHRTATDADWEMAGTLEEGLRCPDQQLRQGERITGLLSQGSAFGPMGNLTKRFGARAVERFAVEAYDALLFVAQGLSGLGSVEVERGAMVRRLRASSYKGLAKTIESDAKTDQFHLVNGLFLHRVANGSPRFLGRYDKVKNT